MSNPDNSAATQTNPEAAETPTVESQISNLVKQITTDDEGNYVFPEGAELSPELKFAATAEKRRRDTQASFTNNQQSLKALQAQNEKLMEQLQSAHSISFTDEEQAELEELKYEDVDAWRARLNSLEQQKVREAKTKLEELTGEARKAAETQFELERRAQVLKEFNETLERPITDEIIASEIPPRITRKLESGEIKFEDFLQEVADYLGRGKVVANPETLDQPSLGSTVGGNAPSNYKAEESITDSYAKMLF